MEPMTSNTNTHKPLVVGSNPSAAIFYSHHRPQDSSIAITDSRFKSLLEQITELSQDERDRLFTLAHLGKVSTLNSPAEGIDDWRSELIARGLA